MNNNPAGYTIPLENILVLVSDLKSDESISASLLKYHVEEASVAEDWETTPIPKLCEYYSGCRHVRNLIMELLIAPTPIKVEKALSEGALVMGEAEYNILATLLTSLEELRLSLRLGHNISFEVH